VFLADFIACQFEHPPCPGAAGPIRVICGCRVDPAAAAEVVYYFEGRNLRQRTNRYRERNHEPVTTVDHREFRDEQSGQVGRTCLQIAEIDGSIFELPPT
jgi:hypothetical protein